MRISLFAAATALTFLASASAEEPAKPNVLLIVADDLGYGELGVQGYSKDIPTPNIDLIAAYGTRFTNGYVSGPYCSPTRAGLLTGRYQQRFGHEFNPGPAETASQKVGLDLAQKTLGDRLKSDGYATAWIGKSHLGYDPEFHPLKRGFDYFFGFLGGAHDYLDSDGRGRDPVQRDGKPIGKMDYLTEDLGREASAFIEKNKGKPWFTYLAFNAVHAPLEAPEKYQSRFPNIADPKRKKFAGLLSALDDAVGVVLAKLRETGQEENTLVFFISDNGGPTGQTSSGNGPLHGFKAQTWEGGIRVPWIVQWKNHLPEGKVDNRPVIQLDILPTALAAVGVTPQPDWQLDGVNLLPYLKGENTAAPHEALYWRFGQQMAIRKGDWKLVKAPGSGVQLGSPRISATTEGAQLYNLAADIGERNNLASAEPDRVKELAADWARWNEKNVAPKWFPTNQQNRNMARNGTVAEAEEEQPANPAPANQQANAGKTGPWKSGDKLPGGQAPQIANHGFVLSAHVDSASAKGVIAALGGQANGIALFLQDGKLAFAIRNQRKLTTVISDKALPEGGHQVEARLAPEGQVTLLVDGAVAASGKGELVTTQPKEGLTIGDDGRGAVGDYAAPNEFSGKVDNVTLKPLP